MTPTYLSRRQLLKLILVSGSVAALPATLLPRAARSRGELAQGETSVLVVGAGVAGLTAARLLHDAGYSVQLLEGRDRYGGRLWTNREMEGLALDMGPSWIHGIEGNPLTELMDNAGVDRVPTDFDNIVAYYADGTAISEDEIAAYDDLYETLMNNAAAIAEASETAISLGAAIRQALDELDNKLDDRQTQAFEFLVNTTIEHEYAASVDFLSAQYWENEEEYPGDHVIFPGGYDWLTQFLAEGLDIHLNRTVTQISYNEEGVEITAGDDVFTADYAIVTLPLGVLKAEVVAFEPPLPGNKQQAIQNFYMGVLNKLYLRFPKVFWDADADSLEFVADERGQWADFVNMAKITAQPVLLCFNAGAFGAEIEAWSDDDIIAGAMQTLRTMYGDEIPEPTDYLVTRWGQDPFSYGSYSSYGLNSTPADRTALAETLSGVLFFAGEATQGEYSATVHGAFLSGQRAAEELMEASGA